MMTTETAQPAVAAESEVAPRSSAEAFEEFATDLLGPDDEEEESPALEADEELDGEESESEAQDEGDEPETPAIDPPVSWGTDAKELFAQLPPELQQQVSEREAQREKFVQQKAGEAAEARRLASVEAHNAVADTQRQYASELEQYAQMLRPQRPDPMLLQQDAVAFYQLQAQYEAGIAQHQNMMQQAAYARQEASQREQTARAQAMEAELAILAQAIPDWNDAEKRSALLTDVTRIGAELGYSNEVLNEASAQDVLALKKALEWKSKAEKWDSIQKKKMEAVRAAKQLPKVSRPGVAVTRGEQSASRSQAAWQQVKSARSKDAQAEAFADFLNLGSV